MPVQEIADGAMNQAMNQVMNQAITDGAPYRVPREPGRWRAIALAAVVHAALFAFLWVGIRWQSETPVAVEAEVWSPQAREAAPRANAPPPVKEPPPPPQPVLRTVPVKPPPQAETPPEKAPDIVLERKRKRLQQSKAKEQEQAEQRKEAERVRLADEARRVKILRLQQNAADQAAQKRQAQQEAANQKRLAELDKTRQAEEQKKLLAARQKETALQEKKAQVQHDRELQRMTAGVDSPTASAAATGSGGNGDAARSQGSRADASYTQKVGAKIKSNTIFNGAEELTSNPAAEFGVELLPDGSIRHVRKIKSSGVPGFDEAVSRAIEKSAPFPPDKSGTAPSGFTVSHRPKDQ